MLIRELGQLCFMLVQVSLVTNSQSTDTHIQCAIIQEKETIDVSVEIPSFLKSDNKTQCRVHKADQRMLRCGQTDIYIRPECVCSFHNVYDGDYHKYSSCPEGAESDVVTKLRCADCEKYSLNNNGPCNNGGKLMCKGEEVAPEVTCQCPPNYEGAFCEKKIETITRICDRISENSSLGLKNCDKTSSECVTYSRNRRYAYRCQETDSSQDRRGLPFCLDTENTTPSLQDISSQDPNKHKPEGSHISKAGVFHFLLFLVVSLVVIIGTYILQQRYKVSRKGRSRVFNI